MKQTQSAWITGGHHVLLSTPSLIVYLLNDVYNAHHVLRFTDLSLCEWLCASGLCHV